MDTFSKRKLIVAGIMLGVGVIFILRLFSIQITNKTYKQFATRNVLRFITIYPARGLIYDRKGELMVYNKAAYDLMMIPREVKTFDTTELCNIVQLDRVELRDAIKKAKQYSRYKPSIVVGQISPDIYAPLQEKLYKYPGFFVQSRTLREYPSKSAAQVLGYVGEVNQRIIDNDPYYLSGDYVGVSGLEKAYEKELRGIKGITKSMVDVHNRVKGKYNDGKEDSTAILGQNLMTGMDASLQAYAELLMTNKRGAIVAIEPSTGEIILMASAPSYDPNLLVGRQRSANYSIMDRDSITKPMWNRAVNALYPPGSTFKLANALIALEEHAITPFDRFSCSGKGSKPISCTHSHVSPLAIREGIRESCNSFFWNAFREIMSHKSNSAESYQVWRDYITSFGFGTKLNPELSSENRGSIPEVSLYDKWYTPGHWNAMTIRSLAIGQGEIEATPLQMVNLCAMIANRGYYIAPHVVRAVQDANREVHKLEYEKKVVNISPEHFNTVIEGMQAVIAETKLQYTVKQDNFIVCGKTGTVQNPHGADHSAFVGFAPKDNPKIAIVVFIENAGFGATYAAPIAGLLMEKYLNDSIAPKHKELEQKLIETDLLNVVEVKKKL
ncbi:penicillin-binding protein 2 [Aquipluma nitroreducens]|uniref:Beta-lactamase n=1 Tax=Aquipluma nitroreducens TaxID=2010828 RepID=A0A5K7SCN6_9BACT|nr:penicillin-binding protein 2 [Aquipluma nitroreducens]BBE19330.1 penicillin-binding protein 2 [Aquipluma nitroreducens]